MVRHPDYGYEVRGGQGAGWHDVGGLAQRARSNPSPGLKFTGLTPSTSYVLSVRAYHLVAGVKYYSPEASLTASTLDAPPPPPTTSTTTTTTTLPPTTTTSPPTTTTDPTAVTAPRISGPRRRHRDDRSAFACSAPPTQAWCASPTTATRSAPGQGAGWQDVGGFTSVCSNPSPGYKFSGLTPSTTYVLSFRATTFVAGVKYYSPEASLTASTTESAATTTTTAPATINAGRLPRCRRRRRPRCRRRPQQQRRRCHPPRPPPRRRRTRCRRRPQQQRRRNGAAGSRR